MQSHFITATEGHHLRVFPSVLMHVLTSNDAQRKYNEAEHFAIHKITLCKFTTDSLYALLKLLRFLRHKKVCCILTELHNIPNDPTQISFAN